VLNLLLPISLPRKKRLIKLLDDWRLYVSGLYGIVNTDFILFIFSLICMYVFITFYEFSVNSIFQLVIINLFENTITECAKYMNIQLKDCSG